MIAPADRLRHHLTSWVGQWPPPSEGVTVAGDPARLLPTWDGSIRPLHGVGNGSSTVIAVPPDLVGAVAAALADGLDREGVDDELGELLGVGAARLGTGVFRTTIDVDATFVNTGEWHETQTLGLPDWLAPFNGPRLVARDESGTVIASLGIKVHDAVGFIDQGWTVHGLWPRR
jgi:hypothetical protein